MDLEAGVYLLEIELNHTALIKVGALGKFELPPGFYYYCGSAQKNLKARIERHQSRDKNLFWHIDYLLTTAKLVNYYTWSAPKKGECFLARFLQNHVSGKVLIPGFGASDCKCESHLIYFDEIIDTAEIPETLNFKE